MGKTMQSVGILPLDDRPATRIFPERIAAIAGIRALTPPREALGNFRTAGDFEALQSWLLAAAPAVDGLIVSADMLAYGGLVASRRADISLDAAEKRLSVLKELRRRFPELPIAAAGVLMRISLTVSDKASEKVYRDLIRYCEVRYRVDELHEEELRAEKERLAEAIPRSALRTFERARARNFQVNQRLIEMKADGTLSDLILLQEDSSAYGPHLSEQRLLRQRIDAFGLRGEVLLYPGADEGTQTLAARWINGGAAPTVETVYTAERMSSAVMPYEHCPLGESLSNHLRSAEFRTGAGGAVPCLWVHTPCSDAERTAAVVRIENFLRAGRKVAVADVWKANGADSVFLEELDGRGLLPKLSAYAGWNTAGNTIGTALAFYSAVLKLENDADESPSMASVRRRAQQVFLWERLADDWGYQSVVRPMIEARCDRAGIDYRSLGAAHASIEAEVRRALSGWIAVHLPPEKFGLRGLRPEIRLPWGRTFEVEVLLAPESGG